MRGIDETTGAVRVEDLYDGQSVDEPGDSTDPGTGAPAEQPGADPARTKPGPVRLDVDRASAVAGRSLSFSASGLPPRTQVSAILDDGVAAAGPFLVGDDGRLVGVVSLPPDLAAGTHELRLYGARKEPVARFAVAAGETAATQVTAPAPAVAVAGSAGTDDARLSERIGMGFFGGAVVVLLVVLARLVLARRKANARA